MAQLQLYNTLTRSKEDFEPINPGRVNIYVCGPTVYGHAHIGHAKSYISFDVIVRWFRHLGFKVKYVQNITDVGHLLGENNDGEDRILKKAREDEVDPMQVASTYTWSYFDDMDALGVARPDISPRATGHITEQIEMIEDLIKKGFAYESNGSVYFDVHKFKGYGKLSGRKLDELESGARLSINEDKRHPSDFAVWKKAAPNHLMRWNSPWGVGFPGWHIECSAMAMKYLGETFDIHGGGVDNIFPHHECEIAQSEAATGKPFARYWLHNNMISINKEKMSKSLGNVLNVKDMLKTYSAHTIRAFVLSSHYRSRLEYSDEAIQAAEQGNKRLHGTMTKLLAAIEKASGNDGAEAGFSLAEYKERIEAAMNDDFNTPKAIAALFDLAKQVNQYLNADGSKSRPFLEEVADLFRSIGIDVLGIIPADDELQRSSEHPELLDKLVRANIEMRNEMRKQKNWAAADLIRDELKRIGIIVADKPGGESEWSIEE